MLRILTAMLSLTGPSHSKSSLLRLGQVIVEAESSDTLLHHSHGQIALIITRKCIQCRKEIMSRKHI